MKPELLAVALQGSFSSYFKDKPDPRAEELRRPGRGRQQGQEGRRQRQEDAAARRRIQLPPEPVIAASPDSTRLVVVGSSEFINDTVLGISRSLGQERYLNNLEFLHNLVDWSVEDAGSADHSFPGHQCPAAGTDEPRAAGLLGMAQLRYRPCLPAADQRLRRLAPAA